MRFLFTTLLLLQLMLSLQAETLPVEVFGKLPGKSLLSISPDGTRMAYRRIEGERDLIVVVDLVEQKTINVVNAKGANPTSISFIDNDLVLLRSVTHRRIIGFRGSHDLSGAFAYDLKTNEINQLLTPGHGIYLGQGALGNIVGISKDRKYAFMTAWKNKGEFSLFKVNLRKKRTPRRYKRGTYDTRNFFLDQDNEVIARERYDDEKNLHRIQALHDGNWIDIYREETDIRTKGFYGVTPDGKSLMVRTFNDQSGQWVFQTMSVTDGAISEPLFHHDNKSVEYSLEDLNNVIHGVSYSGFHPSYEFFDPKITRRMRSIAKAIPNTSITVRDFTPDFNQILMLVEGDEFPGDYFLYKDGAVNFIAASRPDVPIEQVNPVTITEFKARDQLTIPTLLTLPKQAKPENLPAVILPHGGPESYDRFGYDYLPQYFAAQGYAVIQPQFRGSKGFGSDHKMKGRGEWGRKMQDDLTDSLNHFAEQGIIDPEKVCIVGASYGGYAALAGAVFTPDVYQCAISINGVSDVERMMKTDRRDYGRHHWVVSYWEKVISAGEVNEDHLESISPINHVHNIKIPVLLIHSENDDVVRVRQSEYMYDEMKDAGKAVQFVELEDGGHPLRTAESRMQAMKAIDSFIKKHI